MWIGGQWVSVANGSGVGEGGAGRADRQRFPWGEHDFWKSGPTTMEPSAVQAMILGPNGYTRLANYPATSPAQVRWAIFAERLWGYTTWPGMCLNGGWDWYAGTAISDRQPLFGRQRSPWAASGSYRISRGGDWATTTLIHGAPFRQRLPAELRLQLLWLSFA